MRYDLTDVRLFVHVAEAGSITRGAARSHLALASASARIARLEGALGVTLLDRRARGVALTDAGAAFLHHARLLLGQLDRMESELAAYARPLSGHVQLLSNTSALSELLPAELERFLARHPGISVDVEEQPSHGIVASLAAGAGDVGIAADSVPHGALETFLLREDPLVVACRRDHVLAGRAAVALRELATHALVGLTEASALERHVAAHARRARLALRYRARVRTLDAVCELAQAGAGLAVVPRAALERCGKSLLCIPLADRWARRRLVVAARRFAMLPAPARALVEQLRRASPETAAARA